MQKESNNTLLSILGMLRLKMKKLFMVALAAAALAGFGGSGVHAAVTNYQYPCFPLDNPDYGYGQWVSGWGYHVGQDICHNAGTPVYAVADGTVMFSAQTSASARWGNLIMIQHSNAEGPTLVSVYGHLGANRQVSVGQRVSRGQLIGFIGPDYSAENGNWGAHIHFGIHPGAYGAGLGQYPAWAKGYENSFPNGWIDPLVYIDGRRVDWEQQPAGFWGSGQQIYQTGSGQVTFFVDNAGSQTWKAGGANPVRMGTVGPRDRGSGFYDVSPNSGWANATRIKMTADTPPGKRAAFTATFKSPGTPGTYTECFSPVAEGITWLPEKPLCVTLIVLPPSYRGQVVQQLVTDSSDPTVLSPTRNTDALLPGQRVNLKALVRNTGELTWNVDGSNLVRLGTTGPQDRYSGFGTYGASNIPASENWIGGTRASLIDGRYDETSQAVVPATTITPGQVGVFSMTVTVPDVAGNFPEPFTPVAEGQQWFPDMNLVWWLNVLDKGYHFSTVSKTQTAVGDGYDVSLRLKNTGQQAWPVNGNFRLGTDDPRDAASPFYTATGSGSWIGANRISPVDANVTSPGKATIDPGETGRFDFHITVPPNVPIGSYNLTVRPVMEGAAWLPDGNVSFPINVTKPAWDHQVVYQSFSSDRTNFTAGSTMTVTLAVKNTGRQPWQTTGQNAVKLGTARPYDRASAFYTSGGPDPWEGPNRASMIEGKVTNLNTLATTAATVINPGETALFRIPVTAPNTPGTYNEYFNLVAERLAWFPDYGIFFPFTVTPAG